jgi:hypothetical protein
MFYVGRSDSDVKDCLLGRPSQHDAYAPPAQASLGHPANEESPR